MAAAAQTRPVVVELFTSQGCSSCPPAETFIGELARRPDVLALTFHVDYWNDLGWRDRFSSPDATRRQNVYARELGLRSVFTPQAVIDGQSNFVGSNRSPIENATRNARTGVPIVLSVHDGLVVADIGTQGNGASGNVLLVAYLNSAVSPIGRGENAGRTIQETNVVRSFRSIGRWDGRHQDFQVSLQSMPQDATDVAVLVQRLPQGAIVGAAHISLK